MAVPPDIAVDDVEAGPVVELGVLEALGGVELAMRAGGVVEDLGQRADDVLVVVEDLGVVAGHADVPSHEDRVGGVDHDLPHVGVGQQRLERPVAGEVAVGTVGHAARVGDVDVVQPAPVVGPPRRHLLVDERPQRRRAARAGDVEGGVLGPGLDSGLDGGERRCPPGALPRPHWAHNSMGDHQSQEQSVRLVTIRTVT